MTNRKNVMFYYNVTRTVMSILLVFTVYILYEVVHMNNSPEYALEYYTAFPAMIENVLGGIFVYALFGLVFIKITRD